MMKDPQLDLFTMMSESSLMLTEDDGTQNEEEQAFVNTSLCSSIISIPNIS